ncbi:spore gernimation protein GerA [Anoxybacter fermentans]|uniref:Spore gernimation protein GerA n=1 Tax=Anoxybacter fermentans TaxID=1323375 RepID=A0A3Q9HP70_9FIRM|nr:spore germination protein [Anoxybacter fermentans]AZR72315.1 spore gernimation protein GerA [Anoxybacter fermentans]
MKKQPISKKLKDNLDYINEQFNMPKTFDLLQRNFIIGGKDASLIFIDGLSNGELLAEIMKVLLDIEREDLSVDVIKKLLKQHIIAIEIQEVETLTEGIQEILAGPQLLLLDGEEKGIIIDARTWLSRSPEEPESEKATRGPGDGFVETMLFNVTSIRRRIRDPKLRAEVIKVGKRSQTDVALVYIEDIANPEMVDQVRTKLEQIDVDGIPLADKNIEEYLVGKSLNPLPRVRYTERPDTAAAHILEGYLVIIVDNSPTALILPAPFLAHTQSMEEYRQNTIMGTYLTLIRLIAVFISMLLPPLWLLFSIQPDLLPEGLQFIGPKKIGAINLGLQFILASIGIDLIRMASIQTPNALATSLGLIGALMLGEFSVQVGLFSSEVIFYMAIAAIASFTIPGYELALVIKLYRFFLIVLVVLFKLWGFLAGLFLIFIIFLRTESFGVPYLWPIIPFDFKSLKSYILCSSARSLPRMRPEVLRTVDSDRKPEKRDNK